MTKLKLNLKVFKKPKVGTNFPHNQTKPAPANPLCREVVQAPPGEGSHRLCKRVRSSHPRAAAGARRREEAQSPRAAQQPPLRPQRPRRRRPWRSPTAPPPASPAPGDRKDSAPAAGSGLDEARIPQPRREGRTPGGEPGIRCQLPGALAAAGPWTAEAGRSEPCPGRPRGQIPPRFPAGSRGRPEEALTARGPRSTDAGGAGVGGRGGKAALRPKMASVSQATIPPRPARRRAAAPSSRGGGRPRRQGGPRGRSGLSYRAARPERRRRAGRPTPFLRGWRWGDGRQPRWRRRLTSPDRGAPPQPPPGEGEREAGGRGRPPGALPDG